MVRFILVFLLMFGFQISFAAANESKPASAKEKASIITLNLAASDYPPLIGENLPYGGILTRIVVESFAKEGINVNFSWVPNNRAISGAMAGMYDGSYGWAHSPDRDKKLLYSKNSIYDFRMVFFHLKGKSYPWKALEDLKSYVIGATLGNSYSEDFDKVQKAGKLNVDFAPNDVSGIKKLAAARIDLFPMELESGLMLVNTVLPPDERALITYQSNALWEVKTYVVISNTLPKAKEILERFDRGFSALASSGRLQTIIEEARQAVWEHTRNK